MFNNHVAMQGRLIFLISMICCMLCACKSTHKTIDEHIDIDYVGVKYDSIKVDSTSVFIENSFNLSETEIETSKVIEEYSLPDSVGNQYVLKKITISQKASNKAVGCKNDTSVVNCTFIEDKGCIDAIKVNKDSKTEVKIESDKPPAWWKILVLIVICSIICFTFKYYMD